jgi:hypothetical protein
MSDPFEALGTAVGDVGSALINQSTDESVANEEAQGQEALNKQNFNEETNYTEQQEQALRDAIMGVAQNYGNPYEAAQQYIPRPQNAGGGSFGGTAYSAANNGAAAGNQAGQSGASSGFTQGLTGGASAGSGASSGPQPVQLGPITRRPGS